MADQRGDGVFDRDVSMFDNDVSNATALFELSDGGVVRTNEMRRVGYPSHLRESRFRFFGTDASFEQLATVSFFQDKQGVQDVSADLDSEASSPRTTRRWRTWRPSCARRSLSGHAPVHDVARLPRSSPERRTATRAATSSSWTTSSPR